MATAGPAGAVITISMLLSIIAYGATADPLANRYARALAHSSEAHRGPGTPEIPERRLIRPKTTGPA